MKLIIIILILFNVITTNAKTLGIAVLDSGVDKNFIKQINICDSVNFTKDKDIYDYIGHGTNVLGLIDQQTTKKNHCFYVLKVFNIFSLNDLSPTIKALRYVLNNSDKIHILNYSGGGKESNKEEKYLIKQILNKGIYVVVASGNFNNSLTDSSCNMYPACYDKRIYVVGNGLSEKEKHASSNYGERVTIWEDGVNKCVKVLKTPLVPKTEKLICMTGTSQSTAIVTGKLVRRNLQSQKEYKSEEEYEEAFKTAVDYAYKENKIDEMINNYVQKKINENINKTIREIFNVTSPIIRFLTTGRIEINREF